jgi:Uma2 family endonuclease
MIARPHVAPEHKMTVEEFLAFTDTRPDGEHWELIEGVPVLNASPVDYHQIVATNIVVFLVHAKVDSKAPWYPMIGTGTRVPASEHSLPVPDVMVKEKPPTGTPASEDALVLFEVLSPTNRKADRDWRRKVYASVPNCRHYVTVSLKTAEVCAYDRDSRWAERRLTSLGDSLTLPALSLSIPLAVIYRWTPLESGAEA